MRREIIVKGLHIDNQQPMICIPVINKDMQEIVTEAQSLVEQGVSMVEWRADYFESLQDTSAVLAVLEQLSQVCKQCILLVTIRSKKQGGHGVQSQQELQQLLLAIAASHYADMIDVEFFEAKQPNKLIRELKKEGIIVICSHHDFQETPSIHVMNMLLEQMAEGGADIVKLAVMPQEVSDVLDLLKVTNDFYEEYEEIPVITMSMGKLGMISRISGEVFGSCVTFGTLGESSAPGQLPMGELQQALEFMHHNYVE